MGEKGPLNFPPSTSELAVAADGTVWADQVRVDKLSIATFPPGLTLISAGGSLMTAPRGVEPTFSDIGAAGSASLAVVAPGIAEALVATGVGLFAAIPAVIAYNYEGARLNRLLERLEDFRVEYSDSLRRAISQMV